MRQLEPGAGEGVGELRGVLLEAARDLFVRRIVAQRQVGGQHGRRVALVRIEGVGHRALAADWIVSHASENAGAVLGHPLVGSGRAFHQFPLVAEQVVEIIVAPLRRRRRPGNLEPAGDRVTGHAAAVTALPAESLLLERRPFRLDPDQRGVAGAVGLAEGMAAGDQRDRFLVVHRHAREGFADIVRGLHRVRLAVGAFRVDVDQPHLHRGQRVFQIALARVALVVQPGLFRAPVDVLLRLPDIPASAGEAEGLEAHRLEGDITGEDHQVGPRDAAAVLLLDRPQQPARLVEIGVVRPAVDRREALVTGAGAAPAVGDAVGAGAVPGHADEQRAVVAEIGRPPFLRIGHQRVQIPLDGAEVQAVECRCVVEVLAHRVRQRRVLAQNVEAQPVGPPVAVAGAAAGGLVKGALFRIGHVVKSSAWVSAR